MTDIFRPFPVLLGVFLLLFCGEHPAYPFAGTILSLERIELNGNSLKSDSFNSTNPAMSTGGQYDPLKAGDAGNVACVGGITNSLSPGAAWVFGHLYTASNSPVLLGTNGGVGTHAWLAVNSGIEPGYLFNTTNQEFPDSTAPFSTGLTPLPEDIVVYPGQTNSYDHVLYDGDYVANDLVGQTIVLGVARLVLPTGLLMTGQDEIIVSSNASLTLYCSGSVCSIGGNGIFNQSASARACVIYCSNTVTNVALNAAGAFIGILAAPGAWMSINASGTRVVDVFGTVMARSLTLNGNFNFHYDESLTPPTLRTAKVSPFQFQVKGIPGFAYAVQATTNLTSWVTLLTNTAPFTFVDTNNNPADVRFYRALIGP